MVSLDRNIQSVMYHKQDIIQIEDKNNIRLKYFITFLSIGQCGIGFLSSKEVYIFTAILLLLLTFLKPSAFSFTRKLKIGFDRGIIKIIPNAQIAKI